MDVSAEDISKNDTDFLPGSGGMRYLDENNVEHFISADDMLAYGFPEGSMPASQSWNEDDIQSKGAINDNYVGIDPVGTYNPIVLIESIYDGERLYGTGSLIGPTGILICAHVLYNRNTGKWADTTNVYVKFNNGSYSHKYTVSGRYIGGEYDKKDFDDWGIVTLNSSPNVGYFGYTSTRDVSSILNSLSVTAAGYAGIKLSNLSLLTSKGTVLNNSLIGPSLELQSTVMYFLA